MDGKHHCIKLKTKKYDRKVGGNKLPMKNYNSGELLINSSQNYILKVSIPQAVLRTNTNIVNTSHFQ